MHTDERVALHCFLTAILLFTGIAFAHAQQHDHKIIAILPFNTHYRQPIMEL
jgi:hypothetical protein